MNGETNNASAVIEVVERLSAVKSIDLVHPVTGAKAPALAVPSGIEIEGVKEILDAYLTAPERRKGTARFGDTDSFVVFVARYMDEHTLLFADRNRQAPTITAVLNYNEKSAAGKPRFGDHRAVYAFPLSDPWRVWTAAHGRDMDQGAFASFIEANLADVQTPDKAGTIAQDLAVQLGLTFATPARLIELSKGLTVRENATVRGQVNLTSGEVQINYATEHSDVQGQPLTVPGAFVIGIPVFDRGVAYSVPVRLKYRVANAKVVWRVELFRSEFYFNDAFCDVCTAVEKDTSVPLLYGSPEAI